MAKTEVYSWRVDPGTKIALESEARRAGLSLAEVLDQATRKWLQERTRRRADDEAEQARLQAAAERYAGTISAGPAFSENVSSKVRMLLKERHARKRSA